VTFEGRIGYTFTGVGVAAFTTGEGVTVGMSGGLCVYEGGNSTSVNTAAAVTSAFLALRVVNASANANYETKLIGALVEII
jgi:hypothetical protein